MAQIMNSYTCAAVAGLKGASRLARSTGLSSRRARLSGPAPSSRRHQRLAVSAVSSPPSAPGNGVSRSNGDVQKLESSLDQPSVAAKGSSGRFADNEELSFGFPKGSLQGATQGLFERAGYKVKISERGYFPSIDDKEISMVLFRSQEISRYVEDGVLDAGICGRDWIIENGSDIVEVCELQYSKSTSKPACWVLAVPEGSAIMEPKDLEGTIVASELVNTTKKYFEDRGINVKKVEYSWGATEVKAHLPQIGAIVDITETGSSLRANNLRVVDTILESTTRLIASKCAWADPKKRQKIEDIALLLQGAVAGKEKVMFKMNVPRPQLNEVAALLPSEQSPTVSNLVDSQFVAVEVLVDRRQARELAAQCKRLGAIGIATFSTEFCIHN